MEEIKSNGASKRSHLKGRYIVKCCLKRTTLIRSLKVSLVVTPILVLINHWDGIWAGEFGFCSIWSVIFTFLVPYSVSTFSTVSTYIEESGNMIQNPTLDSENRKDD